MLSTVDATIDQVVSEVRRSYDQSYGLLEPQVPSIAGWALSMALGIIRTSDALYHDVEHTAMVTMVGLEILRGRHIRKGGISPHDWLQFVVALGCHDIGYVRGALRDDEPGRYVIGQGPDGPVYLETDDSGTDAVLTPYHVDRGQIFVRQRFEGRPHLDADQICRNLEHTRFPVPQDGDHQSTDDQPGLLRAADLIGQLADPRYLQKQPRLFYEFEETGTNEVLGFENPGDLRRDYPTFFWTQVRPYIGPALRYLRATSRGQQWVANLHSQVFEVEHEG